MLLMHTLNNTGSVEFHVGGSYLIDLSHLKHLNLTNNLFPIPNDAPFRMENISDNLVTFTSEQVTYSHSMGWEKKKKDTRTRGVAMHGYHKRYGYQDRPSCIIGIFETLILFFSFFAFREAREK